jgi:transposase
MRDRNHKYAVDLTVEERASLNRLTVQGRIQVRKLKRAKILLLADKKHSQGNKNDKEIAEKLDVSTATVERVRRAYVAGGIEGALAEKPRSGRPPTIGGKERAKITALACSTPPNGYARWTLRLLAEKVVELEILEEISYTTVGDILKKTN